MGELPFGFFFTVHSNFKFHVNLVSGLKAGGALGGLLREFDSTD